MPVNITINIQSNEAGGLTSFEQDILSALSKSLTGTPKATTTPTVIEVVEADAPNPEPKKRASTKAEPDKDVEASTSGAATLEEAVTRATALVADGKTAKVKGALAVAGAKRVSELKGATIATFLEALNA